MASFGGSTKIQAAASGGTVLSSSQYAICTYIQNTVSSITASITAHYGPGQTIASAITASNGNSYTLSSGVIFTNA